MTVVSLPGSQELAADSDDEPQAESKVAISNNGRNFAKALNLIIGGLSGD